MSILDTFYIMFETDASQAKKGIDDVKKSTDNFQKSLTSANQLTTKFGDNFAKTIRTIGGSLLAFASVGSIITGIKSAAHAADQIGELSEATGIAVEQISAWGDAVKMNGGSAESFQGTVKSLTAAIADFSTKGKSRLLPFFKELGISLKDAKGNAKNAIEVLPEIANAFQKIGNSESFGIGQKLGLDEGTIRLLQKGQHEVDDLIKRQKELGVITKQDAEIAGKFNDTWDDTVHIFRSLFLSLGSNILPVFTKILYGFEKIAKFFRGHENVIKNGIIGISIAITSFALPAITSMVVAAAPLIAIGAGVLAVISAIAILYDDIQHFKNGTNSALGELIKKFPQLESTIKSIISVFDFLFDLVSANFSLLSNLFFDPLNAWDNYKESVINGIKELLKNFPLLESAVQKIGEVYVTQTDKIIDKWNKLADVMKFVIDISTVAIQKINDIYSTARNSIGLNKNLKGGKIPESYEKSSAPNIFNYFSKKNNDAIKNYSSAYNAISLANKIPLNNISKDNTKNTTVNIGEIKIETAATSSEGIAAAIKDRLKSELSQTINTYDDGVLM